MFICPASTVRGGSDPQRRHGEAALAIQAPHGERGAWIASLRSQ